ncbi:HAMP domain-containing protein [Paenibacillus thalictri]|uniref:histidine kinase n=1 Tax=Paenibacillus thalictri TaxID=2527873 RepID=A0A4V2J2Z1_9BACL|nr:HAMP domain-containing protein [Paenibacillus thalictri]
MRSKIVIIFLLLIAVPLAVLGTFAYIDFSHMVERKTVNYTEQIVSQINRSLDQTFREEMQKISLLPLYNREVLDILEKYSGPDKGNTLPTLAEKNIMFHDIAGSTYYRPEVRGIQIIANNGYIFTNMDPFLVKPFIEPQREPWYEQVVKADGSWVMVPQHKPDYLLKEAAPAKYISAARLIREPGSTQVVGMIKIDFKLDIFEQISAKFQYGEIGSLLVLNENNELFYEQNNETGGESVRQALLKAELPSGSGTLQLDLGGKPHLVIVDYSAYSGLKVISVIPQQSLHLETAGLRGFIVLIFIVCLAAAGGLAVFYSYRLSSPLMTLKDKMQLVEQGHFKQKVSVQSHDEIGQLGSGFNRMTDEIDRLVSQVYALSLKEKEAQLSALLTQMNPHFIYNTLESINMMAIDKQTYDISDMVSALGQLLRHSVGNYDRLVLLREELESIISYMKIQQLRYGERIHLVIEAEEPIQNWFVPKFVLQPLVENAIYHGIGDLQQGGTIWISAVSFGHDLLLTVRDDGKGLTEEEIARLQRHISSSAQDEGKMGFALRNMNERLMLMFGKSYGIDIDGSPGEGVSFTITMPVIERKESYVPGTAY